MLHGHANSIIISSVPKQTRNSADELMTLFGGAHHRTCILCPLSSSAAGGRKRALTVTRWKGVDNNQLTFNWVDQEYLDGLFWPQRGRTIRFNRRVRQTIRPGV